MTHSLPFRLTVGITGASGTVGSALCDALEHHGHRALALPRPAESIDETALASCDAIVNLAGQPIFGRFTDAHRQRLYHSRVDGTAALAAALASMRHTAPRACPTVLVSASAAGYYGWDRGDEILTESSGPGSDFLSRLCVDWEAACDPARNAGIRVVTLRTGIVQSAHAGQLKVQLPLFKAGLGGPMSLRGRQWVPWISLPDIVRMYLFALVNPTVRGPFNAVAPHLVRNRDYARTLGKVLRRPAVVPVPCWGPAMLLGRQGARELACAGQRMSSAAIEQAGFTFRHPVLRQALSDAVAAG